MPQKTWAVGEEVLAADFQTYVQNQVLPTFATAAARDAGWAAPPNGARCVTLDTDTEWSRVGGQWTVARGQQVAVALVTASQANIAATLVDLTGLTVTFLAAGAGRRYRLYGEVAFQTAGANGDLARLDICDAANATFQSGQVWTSTAGGVKCTCTAIVTPGAGNVTYKLRAVKTFGAGPVTSVASAGNPVFLSAEAL